MKLIIAILAILCIVVSCVCFVLLHLFLKGRKQAQERQSHFINYDRLTGLGNKAKFTTDEAVFNHLDSCVMVSIHFSRYIELYNLFGASTADGVITQLCHSMVKFSSQNDGQAYRIAFDHAVLMIHPNDKPTFIKDFQSFIQNSEHLEIRMAGEIYTYDFPLLCGIYFLSDANDAGTDLSEILMYIDRQIMHSTMKSASDCMILDGHDRPDWVMARTLTKDAPSAWSNHEFMPYYQPIFDINTGKVVGSELLARWQHPTLGLLMPNQFVPILESSGLILDLDLYMIEEACKKIQHWLDNGILTVPLAINLSPLNIHRDDFINRLVAIVKKYDIPPVLLELELPEQNLLFEDNDVFLEKMNYLHKIGFLLSMGHFAETDIASTWLLRKLPFDIIKMNYHFFNNPQNSVGSNLYVQSFLDLTKLLNIKVVVTQLETPERVKVAQDFGCTNGKGFYFSRPLSGEEFQEFIR